ncbi:MAG: hypothetical protein NVS3B14_10360 [Ktedonobacteraceae bacterium]
MVAAENCGYGNLYKRKAIVIEGPNMQRKKTFSTMEIVLLIVLIGSLILAFLQARQEEKEL